MFLFSCYSDTVDCSSLRTDSVISADLAILILHNHLVPLWATNNLLLSCCQGWLNHSHLPAPVSSSLLMYQHHFLAFAGMGNSLQTEKSRRQKQWENPFLCITWGNSISVGLGFFKVYEKYHCSYLCSLIRKWAVWFFFPDSGVFIVNCFCSLAINYFFLRKFKVKLAFSPSVCVSCWTSISKWKEIAIS